MSDKEVTTQRTSENIIKNQSNSRKILYITIIIAVLVVLVATVVIAMGGSNRKIRKAEEAAKRYLLDLDFDNAILMYDEILKLDPTNVDAYIGLADVYVAKEEYAKAVSILEEALSIILDENDLALINKKLDEIHKTIEDVESKSVVQETDVEDNYPAELVPLGSIERLDIEHVASKIFYEYEYPADINELLKSVILVMQSQSYEEEYAFFDSLDLDVLKKYVPNRGFSYDDFMDSLRVSVVFGGYKCFIEYYHDTNYSVTITPVDSGMAFGIYKNEDTKNHLETESQNGAPNGAFSAYKEYSDGTVERKEGYSINGVLDGTVLYTHESSESSIEAYIYYGMGFYAQYEIWGNDYYYGYSSEGSPNMITNGNPETKFSGIVGPYVATIDLDYTALGVFY